MRSGNNKTDASVMNKIKTNKVLDIQGIYHFTGNIYRL